MSLADDLARKGWVVRATGNSLRWDVFLVPKHRNYSTAPYGIGPTLEDATKAAQLDAEKRNIRLEG